MHAPFPEDSHCRENACAIDYCPQGLVGRGFQNDATDLTNVGHVGFDVLHAVHRLTLFDGVAEVDGKHVCAPFGENPGGGSAKT
jgi:hypothetical protein